MFMDTIVPARPFTTALQHGRSTCVEVSTDPDWLSVAAQPWASVLCRAQAGFQCCQSFQFGAHVCEAAGENDSGIGPAAIATGLRGVHHPYRRCPVRAGLRDQHRLRVVNGIGWRRRHRHGGSAPQPAGACETLRNPVEMALC